MMRPRLRHSGLPALQGFTLVEMLVSVALFSVVMVVALGALLSMSVATRKAEAINSAVNNLGAAMDSMSRSIRTGYNYHCGSGAYTDPQDCWGSGSQTSVFSFKAFDGTQVVYCLSAQGSVNTCMSSASTITCTGGSGTCAILRSLDGGTTFTALTAPEVSINSLAFYTEGALVSGADNKQPKVTMSVKGTVLVTATQASSFNLQTTVTQRIFDQ